MGFCPRSRLLETQSETMSSKPEWWSHLSPSRYLAHRHAVEAPVGRWTSDQCKRDHDDKRKVKVDSCQRNDKVKPQCAASSVPLVLPTLDAVCQVGCGPFLLSSDGLFGSSQARSVQGPSQGRLSASCTVFAVCLCHCLVGRWPFCPV